LRLHLRDADALNFYWARQAGEATSLSFLKERFLSRASA
jgi:hypothetical protein